MQVEARYYRDHTVHRTLLQNPEDTANRKYGNRLQNI